MIDNDDSKKLTAFEAAHLKFLKNQEHNCQAASQRTGFKHPNINQDWDRARRELGDFVRSLRVKGRNI